MRLINADVMREDWLENGQNEYVYDTNAVLDSIDEQPTIDAEPVRHGHVVWKNRFMGGFVSDVTITDKAGEKHTGTLDTTHYEPVPYCSECGMELGVSSLAYCPNCGAKMDLKN